MDDSSKENIENNPTSEAPAESAQLPDATVTDTPPVADEPLADAHPLKPAKKKPNKKTIIALIIGLVALAAGCVVLLLILNQKPTENSDNTPVADTVEKQKKVEEVPKSELQLTSNDLSDFDLAFLKLESDAKNKIYSPLSIKYALSMLKDGSANVSKAQIESVLGNYKPQDYLNNANRSLANAFFVRNDIKDRILPSFVDTLKKGYGAEVIYDAFTSAKNANDWIGDKTLGQIPSLLDDDQMKDARFLLINALAIDMDWNNMIQKSFIENNKDVPAIDYSGTFTLRYAHENYRTGVNWVIDKYQTMSFNNKETQVAEFGASINNYDIIKEIGEAKIREVVKAEYEKWYNSDETQDQIKHGEKYEADADKVVDKYVEEIKQNYGKSIISTDFYLYNDDNIKVFAKDLKEYDGTALQYVAIMPKQTKLETYIQNMSAQGLGTIISRLKEPTSADMKQGVITKITGKVPFFNFAYDLKLKDDLKSLGVKDVFEEDDADLSAMTTTGEGEDKFYIIDALHKANIDFSNTGIKAAAVTAFVGGLGSGGAWSFDYLWDVPVEEIDLTFDQPFLFLIRNKSTGEVWFTGEVYEGKAA